MVDQIRYPIGPFEPIINPTDEERAIIINTVPTLATSLKNIIKNLKPEQLQIPYRTDGWTIQQIIHHMTDNDMNAYIRFKRALTEDEPQSDSYREDLWAGLPDYSNVPVDTSISLLELLHKRFFILLQALSPELFKRTLRTHALGLINLDTALQRYIWHNRHHISQIQSFIGRNPI